MKLENTLEVVLNEYSDKVKIITWLKNHNLSVSINWAMEDDRYLVPLEQARGLEPGSAIFCIVLRDKEFVSSVIHFHESDKTLAILCRLTF